MAMNLDDRSVDHRIFHVGLITDSLEQTLKDVGLHPIPESLKNGVPFTELSRKIAPWTAGTSNPQNRFDKAPIIRSTRPGSLGLPRQCGSIFAHWASVSTSLTIPELHHKKERRES
jgi:hypothetical protein